MKTVNIHASCVAVGKRGVLILGDSGAGKSDITLRLIDDGAKLVSDDRTELYVLRGLLHARAPKSIAGLLEVRGLGIVALPFVRNVPLALAVKLGAPPKRLPDAASYEAPLKTAKPVPFIILDGSLPGAPARIRLALAAFVKGLFREDFNPT
jgi:HPr kinase/phosphorylase